MTAWVCATCGPVPAGAIRHLDHDSPHGHETHECGSSAGLDWTKTKGSEHMYERVLKTRFFSKIRVSPTTDCLEWIGPRSSDGYGNFWRNRTSACAHRVAYELLVGPIAEGMHLDHLCRVRHCVNPDHLEPVTQYENTIRGIAAKRTTPFTECVHGHPYTEASTYVARNGTPRCRICRGAAVARYKARRKATAS